MEVYVRVDFLLDIQSGKITTKKDKVKIICELRHKSLVKALVALADIPRSTFYDIAKKIDLPDSDADLKKGIKAIFVEHEGRSL